MEKLYVFHQIRKKDGKILFSWWIYACHNPHLLLEQISFGEFRHVKSIWKVHSIAFAVGGRVKNPQNSFNSACKCLFLGFAPILLVLTKLDQGRLKLWQRSRQSNKTKTAELWKMNMKKLSKNWSEFFDWFAWIPKLVLLSRIWSFSFFMVISWHSHNLHTEFVRYA